MIASFASGDQKEGQPQRESNFSFEGEGFDTPTDLRYCINAVCLKSAD